ncbi:hypothetical protein Nepgr_033274 [Nepenthes gracilis]|uniref:Uncharacterized protein n=1 Tax=Nepenthes gracilis TaxID=150966 RepID=A0AAD3TLS6_NEPGR|nr:hypothetical protein Nepgr_033274 [Nepenthes gracilis]
MEMCQNPASLPNQSSAAIPRPSFDHRGGVFHLILVLEDEVDKITVTWGSTRPPQLAQATQPMRQQRYAPISQDRPWRMTVKDNLYKEKTCQCSIVSKP